MGVQPRKKPTALPMSTAVIPPLKKPATAVRHPTPTTAPTGTLSSSLADLSIVAVFYYVKYTHSFSKKAPACGVDLQSCATP